MHPSHYHSPGASIFEAYSVRIMLGFALSLALLAALANLPVTEPTGRVGWTVSSERAPERIALRDVETETSADDRAPTVDGAPPPTIATTEPRPSTRTQQESETPASTEESEPTVQASSSPDPRVRKMATLDPDDRQPQIKGGVGNLYVEIEYPEAAREQGIQGELKLAFTVKPDGSVRGVEVVKSLHPLCDSAAVKGVRSVSFVPAKHNGKPIPIRMVLPVRFRLVAFPDLPSTADRSS